VRIQKSKPRVLIPIGVHGVARFVVALAIMMFLLAALSFSESRGYTAPQGALHEQQNPSEDVKPEHEIGGYVGSKACAQCHAPIASNYSRTDMGRSMSEITASLLEKIPNSASIVDDRLMRHFGVYVEDGKLFQSEYEKAPDGKEAFRETHAVNWIIGSGANGFGALLKRGEFLFEAPLSFYSKTQSWALSPGYEFGDYGFDRPILPGCIACHSGQPRAVLGGNGRFLEPPFDELAIGCENCHGPGAAHVREMQEGDSSSGTSSPTHSIVNPAKLPPWLADNICMSCHQTGDAMVLKPGKDYRDFRPGMPLDDTLAIFMVPPRRDSAQTDLLEHYFSMTLSKCYRSSGGRLSCISCHDPHVEPAKEEAPAQFRAKCLECHNEKSCALPIAIRQHKTPPDDCASCHMPKREVQTIAHAVLTNHRIIAQSEEPYPDAAFHLTSPQITDLVHLTAIPGRRGETISPTLLLGAYGQLMTPNPEYRGRYFALAKQLEPSNPNNVDVLEALAALAFEQKDDDKAIRYFNSAVKNGSSSPHTYEQLASLLVRTKRFPEAVALLEPGIKLLPFDALLYRLLGVSYLSLDKNEEARRLLRQAVQTFSQDRALRQLLKDAGGETNSTNR
jgi:Tetratricopeptide repeat